MNRKLGLKASAAPLALALIGGMSQVALAQPDGGSADRLTPSYGTIDPFYGTIDPFAGKTRASYGTIDAFYGTIDPFGGKSHAAYGTIDPFYGTIDPFGGKSRAQYGTIDPFYGTIDPFSGKSRAQYGTIDPFYGTIDPFSGKSRARYGTIDPFYGTIDPFAGKTRSRHGDIDAFYGTIDAFYGDIDAFYGTIDPFYGAIDPFYGTIDPFYGTIDAFYGDIDAFYGTIDPFYGTIDAFGGSAAPAWGDIDAFWGSASGLWGDIDAFWGDIDAFYGDIDAFWGDIDAFYGTIDPFYGDIDAFYGTIDPFYGDIDAFYGTIDAFYGTIDPFYGDIDAFYGNIDAFYGNIDAFYGTIDPFYGDIDAFAGKLPPELAKRFAYVNLQSQLSSFVDQSAAFWGDAVTSKTGQSFWEGFGAGVFAKYGLKLDDASTLAALKPADRARFLFDWYDGLNTFSGKDHRDYWMRTANWNPLYTFAGGASPSTTVGLVDFRLTDGAELGNRLVMAGGYEIQQLNHGSAVASLIAGAHDGRGVMGIAPNVKVAAYNPFDETATAGWTDIGLGLNAVLGAGASVVNLSLGVPKVTFDPEWASVYSQASILAAGKNALFVHAAGNDGLAQDQNIDWSSALSLRNLIVVGSVGPTGEISSFSNTPGAACFTTGAECLAGQQLKNRFLVAPGEFVLAADGAGGITRVTGTSFAAPMVSGAVALLQNRWGWLKNHPGETADLLFLTATDLGAPGIDEVYGHGLLNIAASQSPLNPRNLYLLTPDGSGKSRRQSLAFAVPGGERVWNVGGAGVAVFEDLGTTFRDFAAPLDATFIATNGLTGAADDALATFVHDGFLGWFDASTPALSLSGEPTGTTRAMGTAFGLDMTVRLAARPYALQSRRDVLPYATEFELRGENDFTLRVGSGYGARALSGLGIASGANHDARTGGANPLLGLASGGGYAKAEIPLASGARLDVGATERQYEPLIFLPFSGEEQSIYRDLATYKARAANFTLRQPVGAGVSVSTGYTYLQESNGLLGVQSLTPSAFSAGARTDAVNLGVDWRLSDRIALSSTATIGRTRPQSSAEQALAVGRDGVVTSAFEASLNVNGVFGKSDRARLSLLQPMHVESGALDFTSYIVTDRELGLISPTVRATPIDGRNRIMAVEAYYGTPVLGGKAEIAGFVRAESSVGSGAGVEPVNMAGATFRFGF